MDFKSARTAMVDSQVRPNDVTKYSIISALLKIERENFVPSTLRSVAYAEAPIKLTDDRTLLDARVFAKLLDALNILPTDFVLDVGCGLGYSTAIIADLAEAVVGLEGDTKMANEATENLTAAQIDNAIVIEGALNLGGKKHAPYDVIVVEGAYQEWPKALIDQLKDGGRVGAIKAGNGIGRAQVGIKHDGRLSWREAFDADAPILPGFARELGFTFS
ncbi:MAG: protein-L-isoaspartate O-methyltransferase [Pseudomonadota bacterium]